MSAVGDRIRKKVAVRIVLSEWSDGASLDECYNKLELIFKEV